MFQDYKSAKDRLKKVDYSADFRLADNDDFYGFDSKEESDKFGKAIYILCIVAILYFIGNMIWSASNPPVVQIDTPTYSDLKPLPEMNWNFTPINQRQEQPAPLPKITFNQLER